MTTLEESLAQVKAHSEAEHQRLVEAKAKGEIWYESNPANLHIWRTQVYDRSNWNRPHVFETLHVSREAAYRAAAERVKERFLDSHPCPNEEIVERYNSGDYEGLVSWVSDHLGLRQTVTSVVVGA